MSRVVWLSMCALLLGSVGCKTKTSTDAAANTAVKSEQKTAAVVAPVLSKPLAVGEQAWDFTALAHNGQRVRLSDFLDKPVVVYFCAQVSAAPCAELARGLTQQWLELNPALSMVFGVSADDTVVQREYGIEHEVPFLFLADSSGQLQRAFGVPAGSVVSYLLDRERKVRAVFSPPAGTSHAAEVRAALQQDAPLPTYPL